jgi:quinol monooxygenase YgiN
MTASTPVTVVARFKIKPRFEAEFERAIAEFVPHCVADPGLLRFWVYRDPEEPRRFMFYEDWETRAHFDASMVAAWRDDYMAATKHLWDDERVIEVWVRESGAWDPLGPDGQPRSLSQGS